MDYFRKTYDGLFGFMRNFTAPPDPVPYNEVTPADTTTGGRRKSKRSKKTAKKTKRCKK